jgi:O-antigen ligase
MSRSRTPVATPTAQPVDNSVMAWKAVIWLLFFANSIFLIWNCMDRYLASRFLFASVALLVLTLWLWRDLRRHTDWRLTIPDLALLGWYGLHLASISWSMSWSEGIFYTQKTLILFGVYWLARQAWARHEDTMNRTLAQATNWLIWITVSIISVQIMAALGESGLDNDALYAWATGLYGNKGLASDFLFFLLIFNGLARPFVRNQRLWWLQNVLLLALIVLLQTRTVYLAVVAGAGFYAVVRAATDRTFQHRFIKKILPVAVVTVGLLAALLALKGRGTSLAERLNPATYLESASANERRFVWYKTDLLCADHPVWGVGAGSWKFWLPSKSLQGAYRLQEAGVVFTRAHNDYLEVKAELGWVGVIWFIALFGLAFIGIWRGLRGTPAEREVARWVMAGLIGYCVIQFFDFPRERIEMQVILALFFALAAHLGRSFWSLEMPNLRLAPAAVLLLGGLCVGYAFNTVVGYYRIMGEIHNLRMAKAHATGNAQTTIREARAARNMFYEYNDVALPLPYFEGVSYYKLKDISKAMQPLEESLRLNPWSFQVINNYASALAAEKRYEEAIPFFKKAIEINPKYDEGKFNLAFSYYHLNDRATALEWLQKVDTIPNPQSEADRAKNKATLSTKATFLKTIEGAK